MLLSKFLITVELKFPQQLLNIKWNNLNIV
jgi:hypothetical protein